MAGNNTQQIKQSRSTTAQDARLFRNNKHLDTQLPALPANSDEYEWETVAERTADSTVSEEDRRQQSWVLNLRSKGYTLRQICRMTGIKRAAILEWEEYDVAFRTALERAREDWLDHEVESLIPLAKRTLRGRTVRKNKDGKKMFDRSEQEAVRLLADVTMKIAGKTMPEKWGGVEADSGARVLLQINIPPKQPQVEGEQGEWSSDASGQAARAAAISYQSSRTKRPPTASEGEVEASEGTPSRAPTEPERSLANPDVPSDEMPAPPTP